jgi:hypothetical protein
MKLTPISTFALGLVFSLFVMPAYAIENEVVVSAAGATGNEVVLEKVSATQDALVVIHGIKADGDNRTPDPDVVLGFVAVKAGENADLKVKLDQPLAPGRYIAVLYFDAGEIGGFEPGTDKPAFNSDGKPVRDRFKAK